ncbi:hypothetical protein O4H48_13995 [Rhodobacteraceae bacterium G21628-S1]|nr:hypothetical protein [Rhodobacteraceae bacterium G21628-S1]
MVIKTLGSLLASVGAAWAMASYFNSIGELLLAWPWLADTVDRFPHLGIVMFLLGVVAIGFPAFWGIYGLLPRSTEGPEVNNGIEQSMSVRNNSGTITQNNSTSGTEESAHRETPFWTKQNITAHNNSGTINQTNHNTINYETPPRLDIVKGPVAEHREDGSVITQYWVEITRPVHEVVFQALGPTVTGLVVSKDAKGALLSGNTKPFRRTTSVPNVGFEESFEQASGSWIVTVFSSDDQGHNFVHNLTP